MSSTTTPLLSLRQQRAVALVPTVRRIAGGYRVSSATRNEDYLVSQPNGLPAEASAKVGHLVCTCPDYQRHFEDPEYECKHICAVEMALEEGRVPEMANGLPGAEPVVPSSPNGLQVLHRYLPNEDPVRVKLIKNTKGYSWEISVAERDPDTALATLQDIEQRVRHQFGDTPDEP
jgi:hypothetical protein